MTRALLIAPEWLGRSGLWSLDARGKRKAVEAEDIGLSEDFADRLEAWVDAFDAIYNEDDPAASAFANEIDRLAWEAEGAALADAAAEELGPGWTVSLDLTSWHGKT